jgi:hypothetical protein
MVSPLTQGKLVTASSFPSPRLWSTYDTDTRRTIILYELFLFVAIFLFVLTYPFDVLKADPFHQSESNFPPLFPFTSSFVIDTIVVIKEPFY